MSLRCSGAFSTPSKSLMLAKSSEASFPLLTQRTGAEDPNVEPNENRSRKKELQSESVLAEHLNRDGALHRAAFVNSRPRGMSPSKTELSPSIRMAMASPCLCPALRREGFRRFRDQGVREGGSQGSQGLSQVWAKRLRASVAAC